MVLRYARLQIATRKAAAKPLRWHYTHTTQQARWSPRTRPTAGHRHTLLRPTLPIPDQIRPTSTSLHRPLSRLTFSHSLDALRNAFTYQATRNANKHGQVRTTPPFFPSYRVVPCGSSNLPPWCGISLSLLGKIRQDRESRCVRVFISFARTVLTADPLGAGEGARSLLSLSIRGSVCGARSHERLPPPRNRHIWSRVQGTRRQHKPDRCTQEDSARSRGRRRAEYRH